MAKRFKTITDTTAVPGASASGSFRTRIPSNDGRLQNVKATILKGASLATLDEIRVAITELRLKLGTDDVRKISAADYLAILQANGYTLRAGILPYFLAEPWRATVMDTELLALEMRRYGAYVDLELDVTNTATALAFNFKTETEDTPKTQDGQPLFAMIDWTHQNESVGGGDRNILLDPLSGPLQRLYIVTPSGVTLSRVKVFFGRGNDSKRYDITQTATQPELVMQLDEMGLAIPTTYTSATGSRNMWPVVFDNSQNLRDRIANAGTDVRIELTLSAAADIDIIRETLVSR